MTIKNQVVLSRPFLKPMFDDAYFPPALVEQGKQILLQLCERIEAEQPQGKAVLSLTHAATERFNQLGEEFVEQGSELETAAREAIAEEFDFILRTYGYDVDIEDAIAPRDW